MLALVDGENLAAGGDYLDLKDLVRTEAKVGAENGMPAATAVTNDADTPGRASNNRLVMFSRGEVGGVRRSAAADGQGTAADLGLAALELELAIVVLGVIEMMDPDGQRSRGNGPAVEVVASALDVESDVVLAGCDPG